MARRYHHSKSHRYEKISYLGEGQFATVYKARDIADNDKIVAVKKIKVGTRAEAANGINRTALREIKILQELSHENIIGLLDVFGHRSNVSLVFDFMATDLEVIIKDNSIILTPADIKSYVIQTLKGLEYLHKHWILHRDMKPNNLLLNDKGVLKVGDFGLAKYYGSPNRIYTSQVVTRWYRCPELLFGAKMYGTGVDIWAVGCILAELLLRVPLLPGSTDLDQLCKIFELTGTPTTETWPEIESLPDFVVFKPVQRVPLEQVFTAADDSLLDFIKNLIALNPLDRYDASQALQSKYATGEPAPTPPNLLPLPGVSAAPTNKDTSVSRKRKADTAHSGLKKKLDF